MWISWNLADFMWISWNLEDFMRSTWKPYKSNNSTKTLQFHGVQWEGYVSGFHEIRRISWNLPDFTKSTRFHELCRISKDQLPGMVRPMFCFCLVSEKTVKAMLISYGAYYCRSSGRLIFNENVFQGIEYNDDLSQKPMVAPVNVLSTLLFLL